MSTNTRVIHAPPARIWEVLSDGWLYPVWVVGASRMRDVDAEWPQPGSRLHHSVGVWPLLVSDHSEVLDANPPHRLRLRVRGWPLGAAEVLITVAPQGPDAEVIIEEEAVAGPGLLVPAPIRGLTLHWRNTETLRRLAYIAERR